MLSAFVLAVGGAPAPSSERPQVVDRNGVVYRYFPGYGYQFHPLASFARLNALVSQQRAEDARRLANSLLARASERNGALYWEYGFPFGGPTHWTSGFAQAVAAQSLARAGYLLFAPALERAAYRAFRAITQSFLRPLAGGAWILEYSFTDAAILNAQLQTLLSLDDYAALTAAPDVHRTVARLDVASRALLPRFDTGCWSRYELGGADATVHYHAYHVQLLRRLAATRRNAIWKRTATRWARFLRERDLPCWQRS